MGDPYEPADDQFTKLLGRAIDDHVWPVTVDRVGQWAKDDIYDVLEVLHDHSSWPGTWDDHPFGGCPGHPDSFSRACGQALFRWRINDVLKDSEHGVRFADAGEDRGRIVRAVAESTDVVVDIARETPIPGDDEVVAHAIATFRGRTQDVPAMRSAIVDLAGVLEANRNLLKRELLTRDESDLFEIANKFDLRHRKPDQRRDYDPVFLEWLFQWYLATVTLTGRLRERGSVAT